MKKMFLSYCGADKPEVDRLDRELRRRGVPVWRDHRDLTGGRATLEEIRKAFDNSLGSIFYLTHAAAESEWVRETERGLALAARERWKGTGIVSIFRHGLAAITELMQKRGKDPTRPELYDPSPLHGYIVDPENDPSEELRHAANKVLGACLAMLDETKASGEPWKVGLVTRGGTSPKDYGVELLLDWSDDFPDGGPASPKEPPQPGQWRESLDPALNAFGSHIKHRMKKRRLTVVPHCHLTLALAFGFRFRRNTHVDLTVIEPNRDEAWLGPKAPLAGDPDAWTCEKLELGPGQDVALAINITQPRERFVDAVRTNARHSSIGTALLFEPADGTSTSSFAGLDSTDPHRRAVAIIDRLQRDPSYSSCDTLHLYIAVPAGFAVLLAQQFSNTCPVQTYEWSNSEKRYSAGALLVSS